MLPYTCLSCSCIWSYFRPFPKRFRCDWLTSQARYVRVHFTSRAMNPSCESPWHSLAKHHVLEAAESGKRNYFRPLLSEPDVKVSLHPAQASQRPCDRPVSGNATCWLHDTRRKSMPTSAP